MFLIMSIYVNTRNHAFINVIIHNLMNISNTNDRSRLNIIKRIFFILKK